MLLLKVAVDAVPGVRRVMLNGELDMETVSLLHEVVREGDEDTLELDLSGLSFVDSTGLKGLLDINNNWQQKGGQVLILHPQPDVAEVMRLVGLDRLLAQNGALAGEER
jgi:anti-sigma B factor antagonist/stage II sporulation protein AA (anti-sigma F factor antagonist)